MKPEERKRLLTQIAWDYNLTYEEINQVLESKSRKAGHYNKNSLFVKLLETYPWFTLLSVFNPDEIRKLLTISNIKRIRSVALRKKYAYIRKRLQETIPASE